MRTVATMYWYSRFKVIYDEKEKSYKHFKLYRFYYDDGWHRRLIGKYPSLFEAMTALANIAPILKAH